MGLSESSPEAWRADLQVPAAHNSAATTPIGLNEVPQLATRQGRDPAALDRGEPRREERATWLPRANDRFACGGFTPLANADLCRWSDPP